MSPTEIREHNARLDAMDAAQKTAVDAELVRHGVAHALEAMEWLADQAGEHEELETRVYYGGHGEDEEPSLTLYAYWWDGDESVPVESCTVSAGASKRKMRTVVGCMLDEYRRQVAERRALMKAAPAASLLELAQASRAKHEAMKAAGGVADDPALLPTG